MVGMYTLYIYIYILMRHDFMCPMYLFLSPNLDGFAMKSPGELAAQKMPVTCYHIGVAEDGGIPLKWQFQQDWWQLWKKTLDFGVTQFQTTPHGWSSSHVIVYIRSVPFNIAESPNHSRANHQRHGGWKGLNSTIPVTKGLSYALLTDHSAGYGWK